MWNVDCLVAFTSAVLVATLYRISVGWVADASWKAVFIQPVNITVWMWGIDKIVDGVWPKVAYAIGATLGVFIAISYRRWERRRNGAQQIQ